jgi:fibronectin type 3 domain-containing protein
VNLRASAVCFVLCLFAAVARAESIRLAWNPNLEANVAGYNVYRSQTSGTGYTRLTNSPISVPYFVDTTVTSPGTYYYVTTAVDTSGRESSYSQEVKSILGSYDPNPQTAALAIRAIPGSTVDAGQLVVLSGSVWNPDNKNLRFTWSQTQGPAVSIIGAANPEACFVAPALAQDATLVFILTVTDADNTSITDTIQIIVRRK